MNIINKSPEEFAKQLAKNTNDFGYIISTPEGIQGSDSLFSILAKEMAMLDDYRNHEGVFVKFDKTTNCLYIIFIHSTKRGQAQGGTRLKFDNDYTTISDVLEDGLRLSKGMTDKNAIAKLWWGGGKAIICPINTETFQKINKHEIVNGEKKFLNGEFRKQVFINYGKFVAELGGAYIAAEDMNTTKYDMADILSVCRYVTCLPEEVGGSGNPSEWTAKGVFNAMLATVHHFENKETLSGKTISIQGIGNVGMPLAKLVLKDGGNLIVYDKSPIAGLLYEELRSYAQGMGHGNVEILTNGDDIYSTKADIFAPCSIGGILSTDTIDKLECKYIIGAANNQLKDFDQDYKTLGEKNIVYVPDFYINRMGIINCANEQYGRLQPNLELEVEKIKNDAQNGTLALLQVSTKNNQYPQEVALKWATEWAQELHPIWGHRGWELIMNYVQQYT